MKNLEEIYSKELLFPELPNLPGFPRFPSLQPRTQTKSQSLNFKNGYMVVKNRPTYNSISTINNPAISFLDTQPPTIVPTTMISSHMMPQEVTDPSDIRGRYSLSRQKQDRENKKVALPFCPGSRLPPFLEHDRRVLLFHAYYEEDVMQSAIESKRVMKCEIYFYVEDGTIEIIQTKQENSGIPQGVYLRRRKVEKNCCHTGVENDENNMLKNNDDDNDFFGDYYGINDFKAGNSVEIYSRIFYVVGCNQSTKEYVMRYHGWTENDVITLPFPRDAFSESCMEKMMRESGVPGVDRKRKMHDLTEVMESMLGKQISTKDRGTFLSCGQKALCFHAIWDDRGRLYGDVHFFRLVYHLADDTMEVLTIHKKNDGRYPFPKLLTRTKLPKPGGGSEYYSWKDFSIGSFIDVFGRSMQLAKCDAFTEIFISATAFMPDDMPLEKEAEKIEVVRHIPPHNGFGSEEDSLRSCTGSINPPPVRKDLAKIREKQGMVLRFNARLLTDKTNRRFVIQYFMEDDTIAIQEPPIRNSGVMGGKFLSRQVVKKNEGSKYLASDMFTGVVLDIMCHHFELLNADDTTYRIMENDSKTFPFSCYNNIRPKVVSKKDDMCRYFVTEYGNGHKIQLEDLVKSCERVPLELNKQEVLTMWRKIDKKRKGAVSLT
eukprot:CAMPEP_0176489832 /NCGR_PEP_ID=MMETSP0200_2-20121128/7522_1 /TAXON_ID=947934 /ORGANISM="Chaetoceros sp., Strain GSL56" /LENGTH=657 /DNA_ID=CAMNT_0017887047 /DNA_START=230 /DNA_END=2200 /DNA_ORIENTATION=+